MRRSAAACGLLLTLVLAGAAGAAAQETVAVVGSDLGDIVDQVERRIAGGGEGGFVFVVHPRTQATSFGMGAHIDAAQSIGAYENTGYVRGFVTPNAEGSWNLVFEMDLVLDEALERRWRSPEFVANYVLKLTENPAVRRLLNSGTIPRISVTVSGTPLANITAFRRSLLDRLPRIGTVATAPPAEPSERKRGSGDPAELTALYDTGEADGPEIIRESAPDPAPTAPPDPPAPVAPPDADVVERVRTKLEEPKRPEDITVEYLRDLFSIHEHAAQIVGQEIAKVEGGDWKNARLAEVREDMDREVWRKVLSEMPTRIEHTNQGKSNGIRSDRDYTLYLFIEKESGVAVEDVIRRHGEVWREIHGFLPDRVEITVMNGEHFFPDWRNEALTAQEHIVQVKKNLILLRSNPEAYWVPGANKEQVHNRALREGVTTVYEYDAVKDEIVKLAEGRTADLAAQGLSLRYTGVDGQFDYKNGMGNVLQNYNEFSHHEGDNATEATRRAKYFNRVINEGLGSLKFFANSYQQIHESTLPEARKRELKGMYLRQAFAALDLGEERLAEFQEIIDRSMQIEADKKANLDYMAHRDGYFADYRQQAERIVDAKTAVVPVSNTEREAMIVAEQEALFQRDQKRVMAYATLAALEHSAGRDLSPRGLLRNALKYQRNAETGRLEAVLDADRVEKVAFERATEVGVLFHLIEESSDPSLKALREAAIRQAPTERLRRLYQQMADIAEAKLDHAMFDVAEAYAAETRVEMDEVLRRKREIATRNGARLAEPRLSGAELGQRIETGRLWRLNAFERARLRQAMAEVQRFSSPYVEEMRANRTPLMMGSSAVNLIRAYQMGGSEAMPFALFSETINYTPLAVQMPLTFIEALARWNQGQYGSAIWSVAEFGALVKYPALGEAMLLYNIVGGSFQIVRTYVIQEVEQDMVRWALMSRPYHEDGRPITEPNVRARRNPYEARGRLTGDPPFFPLFYGPYEDDSYPLDGRVPEDELSDRELARIAAVEFAPLIQAALDSAGIEPDTREWETAMARLAHRHGFEIPYWRRLEKVWNDKYQHVPPNPLEYLDVCRGDVYDWFEAQGRAYKDDIRDEAASFFGGGEDRLVEAVAQQCAQTFMAIQNARRAQAEKARELEEEVRETLAAAATLENQLETTEGNLRQELDDAFRATGEEVSREALRLLDDTRSWVRVSYPFSYATEARPPLLRIEAIYPYSAFAEVAGSVIDTLIHDEAIAFEVGAPAGWTPEPELAEQFVEVDGRADLHPVTVTHRYTVTVKDVEGALVGEDSIEIPVVHYLPLDEFPGRISVRVLAATESGKAEDYRAYNGATVTLGDRTDLSGPIDGWAGFGRVPAGTHTVTVTPREGDERHGEASGSATLVDGVVTPGADAVESAEIEVVLPYIPEELAQADPDEGEDGDDEEKEGEGEGGHGGEGAGNGGGEENGDGQGDGEGEGDGDGEEGGEPDEPGGEVPPVPTADEILNQLGPLTSPAVLVREAARAKCLYIDAAAAQEEVVAEVRAFMARTFPGGTPASLQPMVAEFDAELAALRRAADAERQAREDLERARSELLAKDVEMAVTTLEAAADVPDLPDCWRDRIVSLHGEIMQDVEKLTLRTEEVVAASDACDYGTALQLAQGIAADYPNLSWVAEELPNITDLERRQSEARRLIQQARQLAAQKRFDEAMGLAQRAMSEAPDCEKAAIEVAMREIGQGRVADVRANNPVVEKSVLLLIDTSGSMDGQKIAAAKEAAIQAVEATSPTVEVGLMTYGGGDCTGIATVVGFTTRHADVVAAIRGLGTGGGTPMAPAVAYAQQYVEQNARGQSAQILLLNDGQNSCGSVSDAAAGLRSSSRPIQLDAVAVGLDPGSQAEKDLDDLVRAAGGGRRYSAANPDEVVDAFRRASVINSVKSSDPYIDGGMSPELGALLAAVVGYFQQENFPAAIGQLREGLAQYPGSPSLHFNASLAYEAEGQHLQALNHAQRYLQLAPGAPDAGAVQARIGQLEEAQRRNPHAVYESFGCANLYQWAQRETRRTGGDAARRAVVYDIMTKAQRGACSEANQAYEAYGARYDAR